MQPQYRPLWLTPHCMMQHMPYWHGCKLDTISEEAEGPYCSSAWDQTTPASQGKHMSHMANPEPPWPLALLTFPVLAKHW